VSGLYTGSLCCVQQLVNDSSWMSVSSYSVHCWWSTLSDGSAGPDTW